MALVIFAVFCTLLVFAAVKCALLIVYVARHHGLGGPWARRDTYKALAPFFGGFRYLNYMGADEAEDPAAVAYGPNYARLRELKSKYDPDNFFHVNVNIRPR